MAVTLTHQHSPFPSSGNTLTRDGAPLHTRLGVDLMLGCNNLGYTFPYSGAVVGDADAYNRTNAGDGGADEKFAIQVPTVLPADGFRFCWTLGLVVDNGSFYDMILDGVTLYASPMPYNGNDYDTFDPADMGSPYSTIATVNVARTVAGFSSEYVFIDMSAGTDGIWLPFNGPTTGGIVNANLVFSTTGYYDDTEGEMYMRFQDFSWWVNPE